MKRVDNMENQTFLNEEKYQQSKKKIVKVSIIVLIVGVLIGGTLIAFGLLKQNKVNSNYSSESKAKLQEELDAEKANLEAIKSELESKNTEALTAEKQKLEAKKSELNAKGIKYDVFTKYDDGDSYDLKIITEVLDPSFNNCAFNEYKDNQLTSAYCLLLNKQDENSKVINIIQNTINGRFNNCSFSEYKNNSYISKYCSLMNELSEKNNFNKDFDSFDSIPFYMIGVFVIVVSFMISGSIFMVTKRREMLAFHAQQIMPIAQEGMQKMSDTMSKASGDMAREITKGIEEGKAQARVPRVVKCPNCGADNEIIGLTGTCEYCHSKISYKG